MTTSTTSTLISFDASPSAKVAAHHTIPANSVLISSRVFENNPRNDANATFVLKEPARIKTRGAALASGFEYNRVLFDLHIDPSRWDEFSNDVANASRLNRNDKVAIVATVAGFSMIGLAGIGVVVGKRVATRRTLHRVLVNREEGGVLAEVLAAWNESYFCQFGVAVWVEMSEAAMRDRAKKAGTLRQESPQSGQKAHRIVLSKQARKQMEEDRKYMVVVSPLEHEGDVVSMASEPGEVSTSSGVVMQSHSADLIGLVDDWSAHVSDDDSSNEDPFADPPEFSAHQSQL